MLAHYDFRIPLSGSPDTSKPVQVEFPQSHYVTLAHVAASRPRAA